MISIIICSHKRAVLNSVLENIEATIGVPYEVISQENPEGLIGICTAYNSCAKKAIYDLLVFMHEDIIIQTKNWGSMVADHFQDPATGLIGVAGSFVKNLVPSSWAATSFESEIHLIQHYKNSDKKAELIQKSRFNDHLTSRQEVACLDGVWLCTRKSVFETYQFDEINFPGFHGYDIDFSMSVNQHFKVYAIKNITLEHLSDGSFNTQWLESAEQFSNKWKHQLPYSTTYLSKTQWRKEHWTSMKEYIDILFYLNHSAFDIWKKFFKYSFNQHFHLLHFLHFGKVILKRNLSL